MKKKVFISILTTLICIPLFMDTPLANTTNIQTTNHGTITYDVSGDDNSSDQMGITLGPLTFNVSGKKISTFTYELDNVYTGTITMQGMGPYFSGGYGTQYNCELYMENCTVADRNADKITFYIKEQSRFSVSIVRENDGTMQYNDWYQIYSETLTAAGSELNTLNAIYVYVHSLSDDVLDIRQSVVNNLPDIYEALGYDVDNTSSTMRGDLQTLQTIMSNIGTQIGTFSGTTLAGTMSSMQSYLISVDQKLGYVKTNTDNIITAINNLGLKLDTIATNQSTLITACNDIKQYIQTMITGIDNLLISEKLPLYTGPFIDILDVNNAAWNTDVQGTYTTIIGNSYTYDTYLLAGFKYIWLYAVNRDVSTIRPVFTSSNVTSAVTRTLRSHNLTYYMVETTVTSSNRYTFTWNATTNFNIYPLYFGTDWSMPQELMFITRNAFNDMYISKLDGVINAINNMDLEVNNLTVNATGITYNTTSTEVNNSITEYNTNIDQIYNIENNFALDFETYEQNYNPSFNDINRFVLNGSDHMNQVITKLYNIDFIKYPTILTLAGIVLLALLGV